ncbi:MAG: nodulation protein NfeD [Kiritimatiellae bacterium]|nr:nodulation protein NfeD [Kiritimatiellia bacterium]
MKRFFAIAVCLSVLLSLAGVPARAAEEAAERPLVYVMPIKGMIEPALLYVLRRGVAEAESVEADAIIFVMDTPGGTVEAAKDIVRTIHKISVPTYTFVEKDAFSAGAIIALATKHIYMAPGSVIGDAMPILMTPFGGVQEIPEGMEEKMVSGVAALVRSSAEQGGHDPELAEAMVRRSMEYTIGDEVIAKKGELLTLTNVEAERRFSERAGPLLSEGTVKDLDELLDVIGYKEARTRELVVTTAEHIARFVAGLAPVFLIIGLLGIYIEIKTPGFGLPGIVGAVSLAIFFWGHHIAGLAGLEDLVIFLIGTALLLIELLFIPGFGLVGISGIALMTWAVLSAMMRTYPGIPWYQPPTWEQLRPPLVTLSLSLILATVAAAILGRFLPKWSTFNRLVLAQATSRTEGYTAAASSDRLLGATGTAQTALRPAGTVLFGEQRLDVVTRGEYLDPGTSVRVVETHGQRIVVEAAANEDPS